MELMVEREDVWIASLEDKPGALAAKLAALADAGADLDFVIARRSPDRTTRPPRACGIGRRSSRRRSRR